MAKFTPEPYHCAGPKHFVNGGIIATIIDCHCICTAAAQAYRDANREIGTAPDLYYATTKLDVAYLRPTPLAADLELEARIDARGERTYVLSCTLTARGKVTVTANVEAISVPESWMLGEKPA